MFATLTRAEMNRRATYKFLHDPSPIVWRRRRRRRWENIFSVIYYVRAISTENKIGGDFILFVSFIMIIIVFVVRVHHHHFM